MCNSSTSVFPKTHTWEQHELTQTTKKVRRDACTKKNDMRGLHEKRKTDGPSLPNQNTIIIYIIYGIIS